MNQDFWLAFSSVRILFAGLRWIKPVANIGVLPHCLLFLAGLKNLPCIKQGAVTEGLLISELDKPL